MGCQKNAIYIVSKFYFYFSMHIRVYRVRAHVCMFMTEHMLAHLSKCQYDMSDVNASRWARTYLHTFFSEWLICYPCAHIHMYVYVCLKKAQSNCSVLVNNYSNKKNSLKLNFFSFEIEIYCPFKLQKWDKFWN